MSSQFDENHNDSTSEGTDQQNPNDIASLRAAAEKGRKLEPKVSKLERENAFLRAGINPDDKALGYFYRGYEGEMSADAIRSAAVDAGFLSPPAPDPTVQQHQQGQQAVQAASAGTEASYDPNGAIYAIQKGMAEGGVEGMIEAGRQYGLPVATGT